MKFSPKLREEVINIINKHKLNSLFKEAINELEKYMELIDQLEDNPTLLFNAFKNKSDYIYLIKTIESSSYLVDERFSTYDIQVYIESILAEYIESKLPNVKVTTGSYYGFPSAISVKNNEGIEILRFNLKDKTFARPFIGNTDWYDREINTLKELIKINKEKIEKYNGIIKNPWKEIRGVKDLYIVIFKRKNIKNNSMVMIDEWEKKIDGFNEKIKKLQEEKPKRMEQINNLESLYQKIKPFFIEHGFTEQEDRIY